MLSLVFHLCLDVREHLAVPAGIVCKVRAFYPKNYPAQLPTILSHPACRASLDRHLRPALPAALADQAGTSLHRRIGTRGCERRSFAGRLHRKHFHRVRPVCSDLRCRGFRC
uniref:Uncharacterized protein n=1 Tax=Romanomermis culicivorax TaxID=13658 RepID=A0A915K3L8_ROMCU